MWGEGRGKEGRVRDWRPPKEKKRDVRHIQERPKRLIQQRLCRLLDRFLSPSLYDCSTVVILPSPPELALFFFFFFSISFPQPSLPPAPPGGGDLIIVIRSKNTADDTPEGEREDGLIHCPPQCLSGRRSPEKKLWDGHTYVEKTPDNTQDNDRRD